MTLRHLGVMGLLLGGMFIICPFAYGQEKENRPLHIDKAKLEDILQGRDNPSLTPGNHSYKMLIFNGEGYPINQLRLWLDDYVKTLPQQQQPLFERARQLLQPQNMNNALLTMFKQILHKHKSALNRQQTYQAWDEFTQQATPVSLQEINLFTLPELKEARLILLGEDHTYHYPAEQMVEQLISYNKTASEGEKITHLFVEFSYQANFAMEYIRAHFREISDEKALLKQAVAYGKEKMGKYYIKASLREEVRWLRLGYRLLQENANVHFYAYDLPDPEIFNRNLVAQAFEKAVYEQPNTKAVFIGGALHVLRQGLPTAIFADIPAGSSLANVPGVAAKDIVSVFITGGKQWKEDASLYGSSTTEKDLYERLLTRYQNIPGNWAFKTDASKFGFDYYLVFDQSGVPAVTNANNW